MHACTLVVLIALPSILLTRPAAGEVFSVEVTGQLTTSDPLDSADLNGADLRITYAADSTTLVTSVDSSIAGQELSNFDGSTAVVEITNRPNAAPDITEAPPSVATRVRNWSPPGIKNDKFEFEFGFDTAADFIVVSTSIDFGTQTYFSGTDPVSDLRFVEPLFWTSLTHFATSPLFAINPLSVEYDTINLSVLVVPEPSGLGGARPWPDRTVGASRGSPRGPGSDTDSTGTTASSTDWGGTGTTS